MNVLIIEEDSSTSQILAEILEFHDCKVEVVNNMVEAQKQLQKNFDIIFADYWTVRRDDGFDVLSSLNEPIPQIFILSSLKLKDNELPKVKHNKILFKPFSLDEILWCLKNSHRKDNIQYK